MSIHYKQLTDHLFRHSQWKILKWIFQIDDKLNRFACEIYVCCFSSFCWFASLFLDTFYFSLLVFFWQCEWIFVFSVSNFYTVAHNNFVHKHKWQKKKLLFQQVYWNLRTGNTKRLTMKMLNAIACNCGDKIVAILVFCYCSHPYIFSVVDSINQHIFQHWL